MNRISYEYEQKPGVRLLHLNEIEEPVRSAGVPGYRCNKHYLYLRQMMLAGKALNAVLIYSKENSKTDKFKMYDGFHRYHISKELGFTHIPVEIHDCDLDEFLERERLENIRMMEKLQSLKQNNCR